MTLSDPVVVRALNDGIVPCFLTVASPPKLTIEFPDGRILRRTLGGNTVLHLLSADGLVVDSFPGIATPEHFLAFLSTARNWLDAEGRITSPSHLQAWHAANGRGLAEGPTSVSASKMAVESPALLAVSRSLHSEGPLPTGVRGAVPVPSPPDGMPPEAPDSARSGPPSADPGPRARFLQACARLVDLSHIPGSPATLARRIGGPPTADALAWVQADSRTNVATLRALAHLALSLPTTPPTPAEVRSDFFHEILKVPVEDPWFGLTDVLVPGSSR